MSNVILSSSIIFEDGVFQRREVDKAFAIEFAKTAENFSQHETVKILGIEPSTERKSCTGYTNALIVQPRKRLEWGREYTAAEIEKIGVSFVLITKVTDIPTFRKIESQASEYRVFMKGG